MNDQTTTAAAAEATTASDSKAKTVLADMKSRSIFKTVEDASNYLNRAQEEYSDFADHQTIIIGLTDDGELDPEVYTPDMNVSVAVLTNRADSKTKTEASVKAIVVYPSPTLEAVLGLEEGVTWLTGILEKELNHVAVRNLRKAENAEEMNDAALNMPRTVLGYVTTREASSTILEVYNELWQLIKKLLGAKVHAFRIANLSKKELKKSIESAGYAAALYPQLESRTDKAGNPVSYFVKAAELGSHLAKSQGLDPAFFDNALANRDAKTYDESEEEDFSVDDLMADLEAGDDASEETAAE